MHAHTADRLEFAPPAQPGMLRALGLAMVAHMLLVAALTWGVHWKREAPEISVEAELWSAIPQQAAPKLVEAPPPEPEPEPVAQPEPAPAPPVPDPNIVLEQEKKRQQEKLDKEKLEKEKRAEEDKRKTEQDAKRKQTQKEKDDARKLEAQRQENIRRMTGLAGGTGAPSSSGTALKSSGPSASYAGRIQARIRPNIIFNDETSSNPTAEVEVRAAPDGTIVGSRLLKSSGLKSWDDAVLRAIAKTETLPRDVDGRVPPTLILSLKPKE
jgi:colicin import membrane protein